jgi:hypothetical protein
MRDDGSLFQMIQNEIMGQLIPKLIPVGTTKTEENQI